MRSARMAELLRGDPEGAVIFLSDLLRCSGGPRDPNVEVLDAMVVALDGDRLDYDIRASLYAAAIGRGDRVVARLLLSGQQARTDTEGIEHKLGDARTVEPRGRPLTLGERKSLARGRRDDRFLHLLREPHPDVIEILLGNPHLVESDVLTLASRRPTLAASQEHILRSDRWRVRYRVKRALVMNPYSPPSIGLRLTCCLSDLDLRGVSNDTNLSSLVRQQAAGLVELRRLEFRD